MDEPTTTTATTLSDSACIQCGGTALVFARRKNTPSSTLQAYCGKECIVAYHDKTIGADVCQLIGPRRDAPMDEDDDGGGGGGGDRRRQRLHDAANEGTLLDSLANMHVARFPSNQSFLSHQEIAFVDSLRTWTIADIDDYLMQLARAQLSGVNLMNVLAAANEFIIRTRSDQSLRTFDTHTVHGAFALAECVLYLVPPNHMLGFSRPESLRVGRRRKMLVQTLIELFVNPLLQKTPVGQVRALIDEALHWVPRFVSFYDHYLITYIYYMYATRENLAFEWSSVFATHLLASCMQLKDGDSVFHRLIEQTHRPRVVLSNHPLFDSAPFELRPEIDLILREKDMLPRFARFVNNLGRDVITTWIRQVVADLGTSQRRRSGGQLPTTVDQQRKQALVKVRLLFGRAIRVITEFYDRHAVSIAMADYGIDMLLSGAADDEVQFMVKYLFTSASNVRAEFFFFRRFMSRWTSMGYPSIELALRPLRTLERPLVAILIDFEDNRRLRNVLEQFVATWNKAYKRRTAVFGERRHQVVSNVRVGWNLLMEASPKFRGVLYPYIGGPLQFRPLGVGQPEEGDDDEEDDDDDDDGSDNVIDDADDSDNEDHSSDSGSDSDERINIVVPHGAPAAAEIHG
jgi:hypothetical protein